MAFKIHSVGKFKITPGYDYKLCLLKFMTLKGISFPFFKLQFPQSVNPLHTNLQIMNFQRWKCVSGSSKEPEHVPSMSGMSEIAACPPPPIDDDTSVLPSSTSVPPPVGNFLPVQWMPVPVCQLLYCSTVLFKVLYWNIKNVLSFVCFLCLICMKVLQTYYSSGLYS